MKRVLFLTLLSIFFTAYSDEAVHEKLLARHVGNWTTSLKATVSINGNVANQLNFKGLRQAKEMFKGKVISSKFYYKGQNFEGGKSHLQGMSFMMWDKDHKCLRYLDLMDDGMAFTGLFKVIDEKSYQTVFKREEGVNNKSGVSFTEGDRKMSSFMISETPKYGTVSEMKWENIKSDDKDFKVELSDAAETNSKLISYKTPKYKWILKSKFLYSEDKDENGQFISIIGIFPGQTGKKFNIYEDGSVKAYRPINIHTWKEVEIKQ